MLARRQRFAEHWPNGRHRSRFRTGCRAGNVAIDGVAAFGLENWCRAICTSISLCVGRLVTEDEAGGRFVTSAGCGGSKGGCVPGVPLRPVAVFNSRLRQHKNLRRVAYAQWFRNARPGGFRDATRDGSSGGSRDAVASCRDASPGHAAVGNEAQRRLSVPGPGREWCFEP